MTSNFIDSQSWEDSEPDYEMYFDISGVRFSLTVKTSVCWVTTCNVKGTYILKMEFIISFYRDTKYPLEISLMGTGYSRPATLVRVTKVYILWN